MKNIFLFPLLIVLVAGCDRLKIDEPAKIQIQLPAAGTHSKVAASSVNGVRPVPNGMDASPSVTTPINCYIVGVGGDEPEMSRNTCVRDDGTAKFTLGQWSGGIPAGGTISLDVTSGKNRKFYVIGLHAVGNNCADFKAGFPEDDVLSKPYIVGKLEGVTLNPGETKDLPIQVAFDSNSWFDDCVGPDFPVKNDNGGGPSTVVPTKIKLSKDYFPHNIFQENSCQSVDISLVDDQGRMGYLSTPVTFQLQVGGTMTSIYPSMQSCNDNVGAISTYAVPVASGHGQLVFKTPAGSLNISLTPISITPTTLTSVGLSSIPNVLGSHKTFEIDTPPRILPGLCYPAAINLRYVDGGTFYNSSTVTAQLTASGLGVFDSDTCLTAKSSVSFGYGVKSVNVYLKMPSVTTIASLEVSQTPSPSEYTSATKKIYSGSGLSAPWGFQIDGPNQMQGTGCWSNNPYKVILVNDKHTPVIAPAGGIAFTVSTDLNAELSPYAANSCTGPAPSLIAAGSYFSSFYLQNSSVESFGNRFINASSLDLVGAANYPIRVDGLVGFSSQITGAIPLNNSICIPMSVSVFSSIAGPLPPNPYRSFNLSSANSNIQVTAFADSSCSATAMPINNTPSGNFMVSTNPTLFSIKVQNLTGFSETLSLTLVDADSSGPPLRPFTLNAPVEAGDPCLTSPVPGEVCAGGAIYLGSLSPGATTGVGTDKYMTTPGGCGDIPAGSISGGSGNSSYANADFTPVSCSGTDSLSKTWNDGTTNFWTISGMTSFSSLAGPGNGSINTDDKYGNQNTSIITAIINLSEGGHHAAAKYCDKLTYGGYSDWHLPNRYELNLLFDNRAIIPGLGMSDEYWSSTTYASINSWYQDFSNGAQNFGSKNSAKKVRCVRRY